MQTTQSWKETYLSAIKEMMAANETWNLASYEIPDGYSSWEDYYKDHPSEIDWDWQPTYTGKKEGEYRGYMWADVIPVLSSGGGSGGGWGSKGKDSSSPKKNKPSSSPSSDCPGGTWAIKIPKLASGGYTGDWGDSSGRWALLHTKELVLNKEDTANILNAVDMVRGFSSVLDGNVGAMSTRLGTFRLGANSFGNTVE